MKSCPLPACRDIEFQAEKQKCYRCGSSLNGSAVESEDFIFEPGVRQESFPFRDYTITWEPYRTFQPMNWTGPQLRGEWRAESKHNIVTVRMPALCPINADQLDQLMEKQKALKELLHILKDQP